MHVLRLVLEGFLVATSLVLTLLILLHKGRGGGLGSSGVAERNLNRFTIGISVMWVVVIVALNLISRFYPAA